MEEITLMKPSELKKQGQLEAAKLQDEFSIVFIKKTWRKIVWNSDYNLLQLVDDKGRILCEWTEEIRKYLSKLRNYYVNESR